MEAYQALVYQLAKDIGAMAAVLRFHVDAIAYTGGMAYEQFFCDDITAYVGQACPGAALPRRGGDAPLAEAALRVLHGVEKPGKDFFQSPKAARHIWERGACPRRHGSIKFLT